LTKVNEEGQGEDVVIHAPLASAHINLREELPKIVSDLSREQLEELVRNLREGFLGRWPIGADYGAELARLIEPIAPELAHQAPSLTSEQVTKLITVLWTILQLLIAPMDLQIAISMYIEQNETTNININLPPPPAPPTGEGPTG
jgi:hypothetical protein